MTPEGARRLEESLVMMAADHFETLFDDDGWMDALENWVTDLPDCPILFEEGLTPAQENERENEFFQFMAERETDLQPQIIGELARRLVNFTRQETQARMANMRDRKGMGHG